MDASDRAIGGIMTQENDLGQEDPLLFLSRKLTKTEQAYPTWGREAVAPCHCLKKASMYITSDRLIVYTDHRSLTYLMTCKKLKPVLERYAISLSEFNLEVRHVSGASNGSADLMSRIICKNGQLVYLTESTKDNYQTYKQFMDKFVGKEKSSGESVEIGKNENSEEQHDLDSTANSFEYEQKSEEFNV